MVRLSTLMKEKTIAIIAIIIAGIIIQIRDIGGLVMV
jgi:hypothetical protein